MEKHIIIGGDGQIGSYLSDYLRQQKKDVITTTRRPERVDANHIYFEMSQSDKSMLKNYSHAYLCAGVSSLVACDSDPENTFRVNVEGTVELAWQLLQYGCNVIFISSNTVFDGSVKNPNENNEYLASTEYGRQKAEAERRLLLLGNGVIIVRISKLVSLKLQIFATMLDKLKSGQQCEMFDDLFLCPMSYKYLCDSLSSIIASGQHGVFHLSGSEDVSYAGFATQLAHYIGANPSLVFPTSAADKAVLFRPKHAGLGMERTTRLLNIFPEPTSAFFDNLLSDR